MFHGVTSINWWVVGSVAGDDPGDVPLKVDDPGALAVGPLAVDGAALLRIREDLDLVSGVLWVASPGQHRVEIKYDGDA